MRIRTSLFVLVGGAMLPLVVLAALTGAFLVNQQIETARQGAIDRNRAFMTAVDAEIQGHIATLQALAASEALEINDLRAFRKDAIRVLGSQPDWQNVVLYDTGSKMVVNARQEELISSVDPASIRQVLETGKPAIGDIRFRPITQKFGVPVRFPVFRHDVLQYVLTAVVDPRVFQKLIGAQQLPPTWVSGLVDRSGHFIARVPPRAHSDLASNAFLDATATSAEGWYRGASVEGFDVFTAHKTSQLTGWRVGLGIPSNDLRALGLHAGIVMGVGTLVSLLAAIGFAWLAGRRIATPLASLAQAATSLGEDASVTREIQKSPIDELRDVALALDKAAQAVREREMLLEREQKALLEADRAKNEFLAMLGHELRNPLAAISTSTQLLRRSADGQGAREGDTRGGGTLMGIDVIERQSRHMNRLIEDLLDVSRLAMGKMTIHPETIELEGAVGQAVLSWTQARQKRTGRVELQAAAMWVRADRARIEQMICNLLDNAEKFSPPDKMIRVSLKQEGDHALLTVSDEGEGIGHDKLGDIFSLFVQGPAPQGQMRQGLGLGLALVKGLTEMQGGKVWAESGGPGKGASFVIRLPLVAPQAQFVAPVRIVAQPSVMLHILVVEDNDDGRATLALLLSLEGHEVKAVATGGEALALVAGWTPDIALLDIGLPDMTGYDVAQRLRKQFAQLPLRIIAMSGFGQAEDQRRAFEAGIDLYLTKPVSPEELMRALG